jgi:hypothetical protein
VSTKKQVDTYQISTPYHPYPCQYGSGHPLTIHPPFIPFIRVIPSDVEGRTFLVVEVEESWEAPHAIENSKKVYVRTGNAANPYELANVDLIIELMRRRAEPAAKRLALLSVARHRAERVVREQMIMHTEMSVTPSYPRRALCSREDCWNFVANTVYRGGHYFPFDTICRVEDGVASFNRQREYGQISVDGMIFVRRPLEPELGSIRVAEVFQPLLRLLHCADTFYRRVGYRGSVTIDVAAVNVYLQRLIFLPDYPAGNLNDFQCHEDRVSVSHMTGSERLTNDVRGIVQALVRELCWSFWQSTDAFPADAIDEYIARVMREMGFR